ncbi:MAG TPA: FxsB family cyclophane-forming radical SAM/SPASM peptide maturase [Streptosporangiaceae bacterium]
MTELLQVTGHPAPWPHRDLDVAAMRARGHEPVPFRQFILKVHSRCNLSCTYCYVYEMAEQGWPSLPKRMDSAIAGKVADRIGEHARAHDLPSVDVILHGGEPLLAGTGWLTELAGMLRARIPAQVNIDVQTNGTLLRPRMLQTLKQLGIGIGVSLDGDAEATGRHRLYPSGRNSFDDVADGLRLLGSSGFREIYSGILCTIDVQNDPIATYEALLEFRPPAVDLLLPHANWSCPPPGAGYADWLIAVFERWYSAPEQETQIRLFAELIQLVLGNPGAVEGLGLGPSTLIVVDTDGAIKQLDSLSSTYEGSAETGLHVSTDPFDAALGHPTTVARQIGVDALSAQCQQCPVLRVCGGGLYPHRYRSGEGFRHPSVYCADLMKLITHVSERVRGDVARLSTARSPQ